MWPKETAGPNRRPIFTLAASFPLSYASCAPPASMAVWVGRDARHQTSPHNFEHTNTDRKQKRGA